MKYVLALILFPSLAIADCDSYGLYSFFMGGCPQYGLGVDVSAPLCQQEEWKQYSYLDPRCYVEVPFDFDKPCYSWGCPAPYDRVFREPISGRTAIIYGTRELIDWHYRSARVALGEALKRKKR